MPGKNHGARIHLAQLPPIRLVEQGLKEVVSLAGGFMGSAHAHVRVVGEPNAES